MLNPNREEIKLIIIDKIKRYLKDFDQIDSDQVDQKFRLIGKDTVLDSIAFVTVIIDIQSEILDRGYQISLMSESTFGVGSPFRSIKHLTDYIYDSIYIIKQSK